MELVQNKKCGVVQVTVKGRSETELDVEFEKVIRNLVEGNHHWLLLLDLGALQYLRSSALREILKAVKVIDSRSGKVVLCSLNGYVKEIFEGNCPKDTLTIADSVESGLSALILPVEAA